MDLKLPPLVSVDLEEPHVWFLTESVVDRVVERRWILAVGQCAARDPWGLDLWWLG